MRLVDLNPRWVSHGGEGVSNAKTGEPIPLREKIGVSFDCPCGKCGERAYIPFSNPLDGGEAIGGGHPMWHRDGEVFEAMTLKPSIQRMGGCRWHGYLTGGKFKAC